MKVSIIIPSFNRSSFLIEAVGSILNQSYPDIEVIVVDDGSTDTTIEYFENYCRSLSQEKSAKVKILEQKNSGAPVARNTGFKASTGDCIIFMDSDDLLSQDGLSAGIKVLDDSDCGYVYMQVQKCDKEGRPTDGAMVGSIFEQNVSSEIAGYHWQTMGAIYRRRVIEKVGPWNTALTGSQDWEFQARVKISGEQAQFVEAVIGYWRTHDSGRIAATRYNAKYVSSVEKACLSIGEIASRNKLLDKNLSHRLFRRLLIHAIEAGASGAPADRARILTTASLFAGGVDRVILFLSKLLQLKSADKMLLGLAKSLR